MDEMNRLANVHNIRVVHHHIETFGDEESGCASPPGFSAVAWSDDCHHLSARCNSDQGILAFDVCSSGSRPDSAHILACDVLAFLKLQLSTDTKFHVHNVPRFHHLT